MTIEMWESEGGFVKETHEYVDSLGFSVTHPGKQEDCFRKVCRNELKYLRSIPSADPGNDGPDPWLERGL